MGRQEVEEIMVYLINLLVTVIRWVSNPNFSLASYVTSSESTHLPSTFGIPNCKMKLTIVPLFWYFWEDSMRINKGYIVSFQTISQMLSMGSKRGGLRCRRKFSSIHHNFTCNSFALSEGHPTIAVNTHL